VVLGRGRLLEAVGAAVDGHRRRDKVFAGAWVPSVRVGGPVGTKTVHDGDSGVGSGKVVHSWG